MANVQILLFVALFVVLYDETKSCIVDNDCFGHLVCCNYVCRVTCISNYCSAKPDIKCSSGYCCSNTCRKSCIGHDCSEDLHCGGEYNVYCCDYTCQKRVCATASQEAASAKSFPRWAILVIILAAIFLWGVLCNCLTKACGLSSKAASFSGPSLEAPSYGSFSCGS